MPRPRARRKISSPASRTQIWVVPTNKELIVARQERKQLLKYGARHKRHVCRQSHRLAGRDAKSRLDGRPQAAGRRAVSGRSQNSQPLENAGRTFVAVDTVGAGEGEFVLVTQGSSAD